MIPLFLSFVNYSMLTNNCFSQELWTPTSTVNAPTARAEHLAVWTGTKMIVWGGSWDTTLNSGGVYNPLANSWFATSLTNVPASRTWFTTIWTGSKMIVWGGQGNYDILKDGGLYDPIANSWGATNLISAPSNRFGHTAVWTGTKMIIWGGHGYNSDLFNTGGIYDQNNYPNDYWTPTQTINAPSPRMYHTAVWTGTKMIIWGGAFDNSGGIFDPVSQSWVSTSIVNAPQGRSGHTAVWTGTKMIVWGGGNGSTNIAMNSGGMYDPVTNSWTATSLQNAPMARGNYTAIWTGSKMVIWGGRDSTGLDLNTGGIFDPVTNSWTSTTTVNAPSPRTAFATAWAGNSMIIWGGIIGPNISTNTGGIYTNPILTAISPLSEEIPSSFSLSQNYPNPFNPNTKIQFSISKSSFTKLTIYDVTGRVVAILVNEEVKPGIYEVDWDASHRASGIYYYKLETENYTETKKMVLLK